MEKIMAEKSLEDLPWRPVLRCVSDQFRSLEEVQREYRKQHPQELEWVLDTLQKVRKKVFREPPDPGIAEILEKLADENYVETIEQNFHPCTFEKSRNRKRFYRRGVRAYGLRNL